MAIFLVVPDHPSEEFTNNLTNEVAGNDLLRLPSQAYLVSYAGTSRALADAIGLSEGRPTGGLVVAVGPYWGRASKDVWEWLEQKLEQNK